MHSCPKTNVGVLRVLAAALIALLLGSHPNANAQPLVFPDGQLPSTWSVGEAQWQLRANGGSGSYAWSKISGDLPPGVRLRTDLPSWMPSDVSAALIGVATTPGVYTFTLQVASGGGTATQTYTIKVIALRSAESWSTPDGFVGESYSHQLTAVGGKGTSITWTPTGPMPDGLFLSPTGLLSGNPTATANNVAIGFSLDDGSDVVNASVNISIFGVHLRSWLLPPATQNAAYNAQLSASGGTGPYSFTINGVLPGGLTLDSQSGAITGVMTQPPGRFSFGVTVTDSLGAGYSSSRTIHVLSTPPQLPLIQPHTGAVDDCTVNRPCPLGFYVQSGGLPPFTWSAAGLPPGMSLRYAESDSPSGLIGGDAQLTGIPTSPGTYPINITVTGADGQSATQQYKLTVSELAAWSDWSQATVGSSFSARIIPFGGSGSYTGTIAIGRMPAGLTFDPSTLQISGTPRETGGFGLHLRITDSESRVLSVFFHLPVNRDPSSSISVNTYSDPWQITSGEYFSTQLWGCCGSLTWTVVDGAMPSGLFLSPDGLLSGTPGGPGTFTFLVRAAETGNPSNAGVSQLTLLVSPLTLPMSTQLPYGNAGVSGYSTTLTVAGVTGHAPGTVTWAVAPGSYLPPGLTLTAGGVLSGTPTFAGQYGFNLTATDSTNAVLTRWFTVSIYPTGQVPPVAITTASALPERSIGEVNEALRATGGNGTYSWSLAPGSGPLPPGVELRTTLPTWFGTDYSAALIGVATTPGTYSFTLRATSGASQADQTFSYSITALMGTDNYWLPDAHVGQLYAFRLSAAGSTGAVTWSVNNNSLPTWLSLSPDGVLTGTPTTQENRDLQIRLTDSARTSNRGFGLNVRALTLTPDTLPNATQNAPYNGQVSATGGTGTYAYSADGGLPNGLTMNPTTGAITGTVNTGRPLSGHVADWIA